MKLIATLFGLVLLSGSLFAQPYRLGGDTIYYDPSNPPQMLKGGVGYVSNSIIYVAKGLTTGTSSDIYKAQNLINGSAFSELGAYNKSTITLDPSEKYIALGWADFFTPEDPEIVLALNAKYNVQSTFYRQIVPKSDDYLNVLDTKYNRDELKMIEKQGSYDANHSFLHINYPYSGPLYDGRTIPSYDDLRVARSDGTNELGHDVNATIASTVAAYTWLRLPTTTTDKAWKDLTDEECLSIVKSIGVFGMPLDGQNLQKVLEALDTLSARYCGTTGKSVYNGDYTNRVPNTADGLEPSTSNRIIGGIFTGAATTQNHEIWERILIIDQEYKQEFEGMSRDHIFWGTPGGGSKDLMYNIENATSDYGRYIDKDHTQLQTGASVFTSSITGESRSWIDCLRSSGYKTTMATSGHGYADFTIDSIQRMEGQRLYQRNLQYKKQDNIGDGYRNALRQAMLLFTQEDIDNAVSSDDVVKYLYDLCSTDARFTSITAFTPGNFAAFVNAVSKFTAWGLVPDGVDDSGASGVILKRASLALGTEAIMQFCKRANINIISHEQAMEIAQDTSYDTLNYFPNSAFETTPKTVIGSVNAPNYPDGWNGGVIQDGALYINTAGTKFTRQYAIKPGIYNLSFSAKGIATFRIRIIRNKNLQIENSGSTYTILKTITINSADYTELSDTFTVENAAIVEYEAPTTADERAHQNYWKGYENKICGIQIELVTTEGNEVYFKEPLIEKSTLIADPTNVTSEFLVNSISGKVDWNDNTYGVAQYEVWSSTNSGDSILLSTTSPGVETYTDTNCKQNAGVVYLIRAKYNDSYSAYVPAAEITTPLCFKTDQSTLTQVNINNINIVAGDTITVNWGDGTDTVLFDNNVSVLKDYASVGQYDVSITGDTDGIVYFKFWQQVKTYGDITNWILPRAITYFNVYQQKFTGTLTNTYLPSTLTNFTVGYTDLTGLLPNMTNRTSGGAFTYYTYSAKFSGTNITTFSTRLSTFNVASQTVSFPTSEVDKLLKAAADFYQNNTPVINCVFDLSGTNMGVPTGGNDNVDIVRLKEYYIAAGYTITVTVNTL